MESEKLQQELLNSLQELCRRSRKHLAHYTKVIENAMESTRLFKPLTTVTKRLGPEEYIYGVHRGTLEVYYNDTPSYWFQIVSVPKLIDVANRLGISVKLVTPEDVDSAAYNTFRIIWELRSKGISDVHGIEIPEHRPQRGCYGGRILSVYAEYVGGTSNLVYTDTNCMDIIVETLPVTKLIYDEPYFMVEPSKLDHISYIVSTIIVAVRHARHIFELVNKVIDYIDKNLNKPEVYSLAKEVL